MAALLLSALCGACATTRKALAVAHRAGVELHQVAREVCKPVLSTCIRERKNPCPALLTCQRVRDGALRGLEMLQRAVLVGLVAAAEDKGSAAVKALETALVALAQVRAAMEGLR